MKINKNKKKRKQNDMNFLSTYSLILENNYAFGMSKSHA